MPRQEASQFCFLNIRIKCLLVIIYISKFTHRKSQAQIDRKAETEKELSSAADPPKEEEGRKEMNKKIFLRYVLIILK